MNLIELACTHCSKEFSRPLKGHRKAPTARVFCSQTCQDQYYTDYNRSYLATYRRQYKDRKTDAQKIPINYDKIILVIGKTKVRAEKVREILGVPAEEVKHRIEKLGWPILKAYTTKI